MRRSSFCCINLTGPATVLGYKELQPRAFLLAQLLCADASPPNGNPVWMRPDSWHVGRLRKEVTASTELRRQTVYGASIILAIFGHYHYAFRAAPRHNVVVDCPQRYAQYPSYHPSHSSIDQYICSFLDSSLLPQDLDIAPHSPPFACYLHQIIQQLSQSSCVQILVIQKLR